MKQNLKKLLALLISLATLLTVAACAGEIAPSETDPSQQTDETQETQGNDAPKVDLGGFEFILGDWWSAAIYEEQEPAGAWQQMESDYHHALQADMNFSFQQIGLQNFGVYNDVLVSSFIANDPACSAFYAESSQVTAMASQGLLYDLSQIASLDLSNAALFNQEILDYYTINGKVYGARPAAEDEPRLGIFFNKRLFQDAGIDPDLPYTLQENGEWDWAHFEELCSQLTKDSDNDGATDLYAFSGNDSEMLMMGIYTNGAKFVDRGENGEFIDGTLNPAFEQGLAWAVSLQEKGYVRSVGAGDAFDKAYTDFANGQVAMVVAQTWVAETYFSEMSDTFGYVMMPGGPNGHACTNLIPTPLCIPACIGEEDAEKVGEIITEWFDTVSNIDGAQAMNITFRDTYYRRFRDAESVDETITMMLTDEACQVYDNYYLVPNYNYIDYLVEVAALSATPAEKIETLRPVNQAAIDAANALFGR